VAERLLQPDLSTAVTIHLADQIFRKVKGKGVAVGGNTEIYARRASLNTERFFQLTASDYRFVWGVEDMLLSALRDALDKDENKRQRMESKIADKDRNNIGEEQHTIIFDTEYGNPLKDL
jgi:hypothetical protein